MKDGEDQGDNEKPNFCAYSADKELIAPFENCQYSTILDLPTWQLSMTESLSNLTKRKQHFLKGTCLIMQVKIQNTAW